MRQPPPLLTWRCIRKLLHFDSMLRDYKPHGRDHRLQEIGIRRKHLQRTNR